MSAWCCIQTITTPLHERLLTTLIIGIFFCLYYLANVVALILHDCPSRMVFSECADVWVRKCIGFFSVLIYIWASTVCISRIRLLDDVVNCLEDLERAKEASDT